MIGFYNHLRNSESHIIIDSLKLSMELNEEGETSWFTSLKKIGEVLRTPIDLLLNSKVLLNKRLYEFIEQSWHLKKTSTSKENSNTTLALRSIFCKNQAAWNSDFFKNPSFLHILFLLVNMNF